MSRHRHRVFVCGAQCKTIYIHCFCFEGNLLLITGVVAAISWANRAYNVANVTCVCLVCECHLADDWDCPDCNLWLHTRNSNNEKNNINNNSKNVYCIHSCCFNELARNGKRCKFTFLESVKKNECRLFCFVFFFLFFFLSFFSETHKLHEVTNNK